MKKLEQRVPNLRFKGFTDDWEQRKLGDFGSVAMNKRIFKKQTTEVGDVPFYKIGTFGKKPDAYISNELFEEYKSKYPYPKEGDLLISASGSIGRIVEYKGQKAYYQDSNIIWLKHNDQLNNLFLKAFYQIVKWDGTEGSTIKRLYNKNILRTRIFLPTTLEQEKVGNIIECIERLLALQQRKLDLLKQLKKGFLQKMFAEKNSKQPVLRFKGFHDDWEQHRLKDTQTVFTDGNYSSNYPKPKDFTNSSEGIPFLKGSDITDGSLSKKNCKFITLEKNSKLISGQIVPDDVVIAVRGSLGNVGYATKENAGWNINSQLAIIRTNKSELKGYFIYSFFLTNIGIRCIRSRITGTALKQLPIKQLASIFVPIANIKEQLKLVRLLKKMDKFITFQQQKLAKYQSIKKSLLQQMFI